MKPMKQPTPWTCSPTVVSFLTGIPFDTLLDTLGHDGSKIIYPDREEPACREGFGYSEISLALMKHGWASVCCYAKLEHDNGDAISGYPDFMELQNQLAIYCDRIIAVVKKENPERCHCLAWRPSEDLILDPLTGEFIEVIKEPIEYFECLFRIDTRLALGLN